MFLFHRVPNISEKLNQLGWVSDDDKERVEILITEIGIESQVGQPQEISITQTVFLSINNNSHLRLDAG